MAEGTANNGLQKLKIEGFKNADCTESTKKIFVAQVNPEKISLNYSIEYEKEEGVDQATESPKFKSSPPQDLSLDFYLDDTGIIPVHAEVEEKTVLQRIEDLKHAVYYYQSEAHEPPYAKITWGGNELIHYKETSFGGRLSSLKVVYTLFKPDGTPVRANISLSFKSTSEKPTSSALAGKSSPDLTHLVTVKAGDTLPILCKKIYGNPSYYTHIAKINSLVNFRYLEPGMELEFPPIK